MKIKYNAEYSLRGAFSMIELVFVIVVLGILAGIAIPRFSASRDDARALAIVQEIQNAVDEAKNIYYTTGGLNFKFNAQNMGPGYTDYGKIILSRYSGVASTYNINPPRTVSGSSQGYIVGGKTCFYLAAGKFQKINPSGGVYDKQYDYIQVYIDSGNRVGASRVCKIVQQILDKTYDTIYEPSTHSMVLNDGGFEAEGD